MDPEQDDQTEQQQGAEEAVNAESLPFDQLQARMRAGEFDATESDAAGEATQEGEATSSEGQGGEADGEQAAGEGEQQGDGQAAEGGEQQGQAAQSGEQAPEDWKRKYESVAGNNRQLSQQLKQAQLAQQQMLMQFQAAQAAAQIQQQRQIEEQQAIAQIAQNVPPEMQQAALQEWRQRQQAQYQQQDTQQNLEAYRQYLLDVQRQQQDANVQLFRTAVSQDIDGLAEHIATKYEAPSEPLIELTKAPAFKDVWGYVKTQDDLDLVAQVMAAAAETFRAHDGKRKEGNRQKAIVQQTHRVETTTGAAAGNGGKTAAETIATMPDSDFKKFQAALRRQGSMRGLLP